MAALFAHKSGGLFPVPGPLGFVEYDNSLSGCCCCANIFITKMVNVLDKCAGVTIGIPLTYSFSFAGFATVDLVVCESFTQYRDEGAIA
jgi:hypothetical protein